MTIEPHLAVRAGSLYLAAILTWAAWAWRRPSSRALAGAGLAFLWNLTPLLALNIAAVSLGWWTFDASGGLIVGIPVDLLLAWAWLWGPVPAIAFPATPAPILIMLAFAADFILMPLAYPVVQLGPVWIAGEAAVLLLALTPAQLLARWTARNERLSARAALQAIAFAGLAFFILPSAILEASGGSLAPLAGMTTLEINLWVQAAAIPAVLGLSAVQEFAVRGGGTPVPFDPPPVLVTSGPYAYVRNPMQVSAVLLFVLLGAALGNVWIAAAGVMAHLYSAGLAAWDEDVDLRGRFGPRWAVYRTAVRAWLPRYRPWHPAEEPPALLFVAQRCAMCSQTGEWLASRGVRHLRILAAESHASGALTRITYERGNYRASGVEAVARALEHIHLGWAMAGFVLRLPLVLPLAQVLVDASGGEPRPLRVEHPRP